MSALARSHAGPSSSNITAPTSIRALPSQLASKAAPSVPPAAQTYEPLVKAALRHRLLVRIFLWSALLAWAGVWAQSVWGRGGVGALGVVGTLVLPFWPSTLGFAVATWAMGVVPVVIARKAFLSALPAAASSPRAVFRAALKKSASTRSLLVYASCAACVTCIHVLMTYTFESSTGSDPRLTLFVKSKKHPYYLNGRLLYLVSSQVFLAALYLLRNIMTDRSAVRWRNHGSEATAQTYVLAQILTSFVTISLLVGISLAGHAVVFTLARSVLLPILYRVPFLYRLLRPFSAHFLRGSWSIFLISRHAPLVYRAFTLGLVTTLSWEFAESLFDAAVAEPVKAADRTADPPLTLVSGITSPDAYYKHFAYAELQHLAQSAEEKDSKHRIALFADQKYNPSMWATLARETLRVLGEDYQLLLRRGAPPASAPAPAAAPKPLGVPPQILSTPLVKTQVLKPARPSPLRSALDTFASDGPIASAVSSTAELGASQLPELFRSVVSPPRSAVAKAKPAPAPTTPAASSSASSSMSISGLQTRVRKMAEERAPVWVTEACARLNVWWTRDRVNKLVEASLPNRKLDALAIDALCSFVCASLSEDRYGVVQRDIPRILEALLSFLTAIEDYQNEIRTKYPEPTPDELRSLPLERQAAQQQLNLDVARAGDVFSEISDPLKDGLVRVVRTFGDKLAAFRFAPRTAKKLQGFVDYN